METLLVPGLCLFKSHAVAFCTKCLYTLNKTDGRENSALYRKRFGDKQQAVIAIKVS
jgi:hypothetical protein